MPKLINWIMRPGRRGPIVIIGALFVLVFCTDIGGSAFYALLARADDGKRHSGSRAPEAIVVLGGDRYDEIARGRQAAALQRRTGLPMLITGAGAWLPATLAAEKAEVRWVEDKARNTEENALYAASMLQRAGVHSVYLVTDAVHMVRASIMFRGQRLEVVAAPSSVDGQAAESAAGIVHAKRTAMTNGYMFHELIGIVWYRLRHGQVAGLPVCCGSTDQARFTDPARQ